MTTENGYKFAPMIKDGFFATRKADKDRHAIGMRSIRYAVEKYAGIVSISYKDNWFKATAMLCGYETAFSDKSGYETALSDRN